MRFIAKNRGCCYNLSVGIALKVRFTTNETCAKSMTSIAKKNTLYRKQLTTNNPNIIRKYKTYRNKLTHLKEISKQNYYKQAFQKCHHDIKKTWKLVNEIIAIKNKSQQKNRLFEESECQKQCEDLNNFFSEVGKSLSTKIKPSPTFSYSLCAHSILLDI